MLVQSLFSHKQFAIRWKSLSTVNPLRRLFGAEFSIKNYSYERECQIMELNAKDRVSTSLFCIDFYSENRFKLTHHFPSQWKVTHQMCMCAGGPIERGAFGMGNHSAYKAILFPR